MPAGQIFTENVAIVIGAAGVFLIFAGLVFRGVYCFSILTAGSLISTFSASLGKSQGDKVWTVTMGALSVLFIYGLIRAIIKK